MKLRLCFLTVALTLVPALGCVSLRTTNSEQASISTHAPSARAEVELPPGQAAKVCLAAAEALEKSGHEPEAIVQYEKARQHNPRLNQISRRLAVLYDRQGEYSRAQAEYNLALQANPRDADLLNDVGYFHYERGQPAEAETWLRKALQIDAKHQRAWINLGMALGEQGRYDDSFQAFARVVGKAEAHSNVGAIQARQGKRDEALHSFQQALSLDPDLKQARFISAKLQEAQK